MKVEAILASKGHDVFTVEAADTVTEIARVLSDRRIGAVVIAEPGGGIAGIMSERDVVRAIAAHGPEALARPASELMTREVVTARPDDTIDELSQRMTRGKFRHVPIIDGDRLVGIVSIGDVVKYRIESIEAEASAMRDYIATA